MSETKCRRCGSTDVELYLAPCNDDYWSVRGADAFHAVASTGKESKVVRSSPPTAASIVSWCHGEESSWIIQGVQHMLDRYVENCGLAHQFKEMCGRLREYCEWRHLGFGGESVDELVLARARELESMLARMRGMLHAFIEDGARAKIMEAEALTLTPQVEPLVDQRRAGSGPHPSANLARESDERKGAVSLMDERDQKLLEALQKLTDASREIATEIHALRGMLVSIIAPSLRDAEGVKTREASLRTEETGKEKP
jgi:hypothetical protein